MKRRKFLKDATGTSLTLGSIWMFGNTFANTSATPHIASPVVTDSPWRLSADLFSSNLVPSMKLAGQNLIHSLSPEHNYTPYWQMRINPDKRAAFNMWWPQHNIGRWWDAMLRLEHTLGIKIPEREEQAMLANAKRFFDNPDHLCFQPLDFEEEIFPMELHSLREGLLCLDSLVRYRKNGWAKDKGHKMLQTIERIANDDCSWDLTKLDYYQRCNGRALDFLTGAVETNGRLIEALVWFYESTGDPVAFKLAKKFSEWHYEHTTNADGTIRTAEPDHAHSYVGTLRGLLLYGKLTKQRKYIDRVAASYMTTVMGHVVKESGFTSHDLGQEKRGETTTPGDAAQLGLWLAMEGYGGDFLDAAERCVRARLLPCQITEALQLRPQKDEKSDRFFNLSQRSVGAYGGMHTLQHGGKMCTTDITSAVLHSLLDVYRHIVVKDPNMTFVLFHFEFADDDIEVKVTHQKERTLEIRHRRKMPLMVRIPRWVDRAALTFEQGGIRREPAFAGDFLVVEGGGDSDSPTKISFPLPQRTIFEKTDGVNFEIRWSGDTIVGISPNVEHFPFYPDLRHEK